MTADHLPVKPTTRTATRPVSPGDLAELRRLVAQAERLIAEFAGQGERDSRIDRAAFAAGYRHGFDAGVQVGHGRAHHELEQDWAAVAARIRGLARSRTHAELDQLRYPGYTAEDLRRLRAASAERLTRPRRSVPPGRAAA